MAIMSSNCYDNKLPVCIEKGTVSTVVITGAVVAIGAVSLVSLWTQFGPVVTYVAQRVS